MSPLSTTDDRTIDSDCETSEWPFTDNCRQLKQRSARHTHTMLNRWTSTGSRSLIVSVRHHLTTRSAIDLGGQMKTLNDSKQFREALHLFDTCRETYPEAPLSSNIITQALKACTNTRDLERGGSIHELVSARCKEDSYILTSLIHLYSKANVQNSTLSAIDCSAMRCDHAC